MTQIRQPFVAGSFYPARADDLAATVDGLLDAAVPGTRKEPPAGLIAPHAGHRCSGPVAASAYCLLGNSHAIRTVVILGPAHFRDRRG
jgi:AmmeMemoRadiSam system protein B